MALRLPKTDGGCDCDEYAGVSENTSRGINSNRSVCTGGHSKLRGFYDKRRYIIDLRLLFRFVGAPSPAVFLEVVFETWACVYGVTPAFVFRVTINGFRAGIRLADSISNSLCAHHTPKPDLTCGVNIQNVRSPPSPDRRGLPSSPSLSCRR